MSFIPIGSRSNASANLAPLGSSAFSIAQWHCGAPSSCYAWCQPGQHLQFCVEATRLHKAPSVLYGNTLDAAVAATLPFVPRRVAVAMTRKASTTIWSALQVRTRVHSLMQTAVVPVEQDIALLRVAVAMTIKEKTTIWSVVLLDPVETFPQDTLQTLEPTLETGRNWQVKSAHGQINLSCSTTSLHEPSARRNVKALSSLGVKHFSSKLPLLLVALAQSASCSELVRTLVALILAGTTTTSTKCQLGCRFKPPLDLKARCFVISR